MAESVNIYSTNIYMRISIMKSKRIVIIVSLAILLIAVLGILPLALTNGEDTTPGGWIIAVFVFIMVVPFIAVPIYIFKKVLPKGIFGGKKFKGGRPAEAVILNIGEAKGGMVVTVNNQPFVSFELEIHDGSKKPYITTLSTIISRLAVPQFQPGTKVAVKIDPEDPMNVMLDRSRKLFKPSYGNVSLDGSKESRIRTHGKKGQARILAVQDTGKSKDFQPVVLLTLEVWGPEVETYTFEKEIPIPTFAIKRLKPGKVVPAIIDPENETNIMLNL